MSMGLQQITKVDTGIIWTHDLIDLARELNAFNYFEEWEGGYFCIDKSTLEIMFEKFYSRINGQYEIDKKETETALVKIGNLLDQNEFFLGILE